MALIGTLMVIHGIKQFLGYLHETKLILTPVDLASPEGADPFSQTTNCQLRKGLSFGVMSLFLRLKILRLPLTCLQVRFVSESHILRRLRQILACRFKRPRYLYELRSGMLG